MVLIKKLTRIEVLEALAILAAQSIPDGKNGDIVVESEDNGDVCLFFCDSTKELN